MKPTPIPCHDHRMDGPDPYPNFKCSAIDKLFKSSGNRTPLLERNPPAAMLVGARFDRIHKEVGRSRAARVGRSRVTPGCVHCQDLLENNMGLRKLLKEAVEIGPRSLESEALRREWRVLRAHADQLEAALVAVQHGSSDSGPCWCMYFQVVHNEEGDKIQVQDGHTPECWQAQAVYRSFTDRDVRGSDTTSETPQE
jgi:hypothetical protein